MNTRIIRSLITLLFLLAMGIAGPVWAQTQSEIQKLTASDGDIVDEFGDVVAVDGNTAVVGARLDDDGGFDSGSAYVFTRNSGVWTEQQKLTASDAAANNFFGKRVAVDGDTIVIGAEDGSFSDSVGSAYVFVRNAGVWTEQQKLTASDAAQGDLFGSSVAVDGDTAIIGAAQDDDKGRNSGSAYVFTRNAGVWTEQQKLIASNGFDFDDFGNAVAMDGDTAVIGARWGDNGGEWSDVGAAYVFTRESGVWTEQQKLLASDGAFEDQFGVWVTLDGDTAIIGAKWDDDSGSKSGSAYVFIRNAGVWTEQQKLTASDGAAGHEFGAAVAVSGNSAVIGARFDDDNGSESGSAYLFTRSAGVWTEQPKLIPTDAAAFDEFGQGIAMDEETVLVGADRDDDNGPASGSVYVFEVRGTDTLAVTDLQLEVLSDLDGDQSPELAAATRELATGQLKVRIVSPMNRTIIGNISFGQEPFRGMTSLRNPATGETNGIAVLSERQDARLRLQVRDVTSGALVNNQVYFWGAFSSVGLATLSDLGGGSSDDVAVLGVPSPSGQPTVQIRDGVSGALVKNAYFVDETWQVKQLLDLGETDYRSGTDIGVLAVNVDGDIKIPLADAATGTPIRDLKLLNDNWEPLQAIVIPDYNGNGIAEVALLGSKKGTNRLIVQVRDGRNNAFLTNILPFSAAWRPVKMALLPDRNANGAAEIAIMAVKEGSDRLLVQVRDSRTGQFLRYLTPLSAKWDPKDMAVLPNLDGGVTGLAVLATRREDGRVIIQTINAANDALVSNVFLD